MMGWSNCAGLESPGSGSTSTARFTGVRRLFVSSAAPLSTFSLRTSAVFLISSAYAQTAAPAAADSGIGQFLFFIPMIAIFWFVAIRPQMKRAKEQKELIASIAKGDEVVTTGGIIGRISKLGESYVHIETGSNVELQVQRSAIVQILPKGTMK
jgi:preprotein translocase subunit YajC